MNHDDNGDDTNEKSNIALSRLTNRAAAGALRDDDDQAILPLAVLEANLEKRLKRRSVRVFCGTFNVGDRPPPQHLTGEKWEGCPLRGNQDLHRAIHCWKPGFTQITILISRN